MISYLQSIKIDIPLQIWQTGAADFQDLKYPFPECANTWKKMNPGYSYTYANNQEKRDYIKEHGGPVLSELVDYLDGMFLADLWRYLIVYNMGGIYADLDSVCVAPLSLIRHNISCSDDPEKVEFISKSVFGFGCNNSIPIKKLENETVYCEACDIFCKKFETGVHSKKKWLDNNGFAAIPKSKPLESVLDEIKIRFIEFKSLHNNKFNSSHVCITHVVDCSAFEVGINKQENLVSKTFIYDRQSFSLDDLDHDENKVFKQRFLDFEVLQIKKILFSEYEQSDASQLQ